jgi:hypothetical protein
MLQASEVQSRLTTNNTSYSGAIIRHRLPPCQLSHLINWDVRLVYNWNVEVCALAQKARRRRYIYNMGDARTLLQEHGRRGVNFSA